MTYKALSLSFLFIAFSLVLRAQPENVSNVRGGIVFPSSGYGSLSGFSQKALQDAVKAEETAVRPFQNNETLNGAFFDLGDLYYFKSLGLPDYLGIGIDASYINFSWARVNNRGVHSDSTQSTFDFTSHFFTYSPRVGPLITYSPATDVNFDFSFRWTPTFAAAFAGYDEANIEDRQAKDRITGVGYGLARFNTGFYVRYNILTLGFEWEFGGNSFKTRSGTMSTWYSNDVALNSTRFVFGFNFVKPPKR